MSRLIGDITRLRAGVGEHTVPNDAYRLPAGFAGRWETLQDAKKLYVLLEPV